VGNIIFPLLMPNHIFCNYLMQFCHNKYSTAHPPTLVIIVYYNITLVMFTGKLPSFVTVMSSSQVSDY